MNILELMTVRQRERAKRILLEWQELRNEVLGVPSTRRPSLSADVKLTDVSASDLRIIDTPEGPRG